MKIATFNRRGQAALGLVDAGAVLDLDAAFNRTGSNSAPAALVDFIAGGDRVMDQARKALEYGRSHVGETALWQPLSEVRLLAPIPRPTKSVYCVGRNYKAHIEEGARARGKEVVYPTVPEFFSKPTTSVIGHEAEIRLDSRVTEQLDYEVELAMVVGTSCRDLGPKSIADVVFGYTVVNDISARDVQKNHGQWLKGKGMDTYCPIGPWVVTADEFGSPSDHRISLRVNGKTRQDSNTADLLFDCDTILESLSAGLTLETGDIIATGTPAGVALGMVPQGWLQDGDVVEAEVEGIGVLRNTVRAVKRT